MDGEERHDWISLARQRQAEVTVVQRHCPRGLLYLLDAEGRKAQGRAFSTYRRHVHMTHRIKFLDAGELKRLPAGSQVMQHNVADMLSAEVLRSLLSHVGPLLQWNQKEDNAHWIRFPYCGCEASADAKRREAAFFEAEVSKALAAAPGASKEACAVLLDVMDRFDKFLWRHVKTWDVLAGKVPPK
jgi:hypothetical protein